MRNLTSLVLLGSSLVACVQKSDNVDTAESAIDSSDAVSAEGNVMMTEVDGADMVGLTAPTADQVAARIAANATLRWGNCAVIAQTGANVTITYTDCTGPRGLLHVTGELDLVVSVSLAGGISVHGTSSDLQVNGATLVIDANATYTVTATGHTITVATTGSGTGPRGNEIDHTGNYTVTWDTASECRSIDGQWSTEITSTAGSATRSNDVSLTRCAGGCPTGTVTHNFLRGSSITVTFDGTAVATWSASTGRTGTVQLTCQ